jgi:hypothetical protein
MDADFCAQFIKVLHTLGTPGFPSLMTYDKVCVSVCEKLIYLTTDLATGRTCQSYTILVQRI